MPRPVKGILKASGRTTKPGRRKNDGQNEHHLASGTSYRYQQLPEVIIVVSSSDDEDVLVMTDRCVGKANEQLSEKNATKRGDKRRRSISIDGNKAKVTRGKKMAPKQRPHTDANDESETRTDQSDVETGSEPNDVDDEISFTKGIRKGSTPTRSSNHVKKREYGKTNHKLKGKELRTGSRPIPEQDVSDSQSDSQFSNDNVQQKTKESVTSRVGEDGGQSSDESDASGPNEYIVEAILERRNVGRGVQYYIKWKNFPHSDNSWEPSRHLNCPDLVEKFEKNFEGPKPRGRPAGKRKRRSDKSDRKSVGDVRQSRTSERPLRKAKRTNEQNGNEDNENGKGNEPEGLGLSDADSSNATIIATTVDTREICENHRPSREVSNASDLVEQFDQHTKTGNEAAGSGTIAELASCKVEVSPDDVTIKEEPELRNYPDENRTVAEISKADVTLARDDGVRSTSAAATNSGTKRKRSLDNDDREPKGFARGRDAEEVLGATVMNGNLLLLIKWKGISKADLVMSKEANEKIPQLVIAYYERLIIISRNGRKN